MAKEKSELSKEERKAAKAAKQEAKSTSSSAAATLTVDAGVSKPKSEKKEKEKNKKSRKALAEKALNEIQHDGEAVEVNGGDEEEGKKEKISVDVDSDAEETKKGGVALRPIGALVPFANPLADEKVGKKVFKGVKKAAGHRTLKRGVKEVVKALRKSSSNTESTPSGIVVLAADISPMDVISHIPVLCEDHGIPYIYVTSRAELGMAGQTKRPTSVVLIGREVGKGKEDGEEWAEVYKGLVKVVEREGVRVKV